MVLPVTYIMNLKAAASAAAIMTSSSSSSTSIIVGLNAALQKRFVLPSGNSLIPGNVHRAQEIQTGLGGKGQDVAVTLSCLKVHKNEAENLQVAQFVGLGGAGDTVHELVQHAMGDQALDCTVRTQASMRTCTSIVASDATTELVEPSGTVSATEHDELLQRIQQQSPVNALCIMGSMPPGCPPDSYAQIYQTVAQQNRDEEASTLLCLIDSVIGLEPLLETIASFAQKTTTTTTYKTVLKINASELCRLVNIDKASSETGGVAIDELVQAVQAFWKHYHQPAITALAITDGAHPAYLVSFADENDNDDNDNARSNMHIYRLAIPQLSADQTLYPIGAGDSVAAGMLAAWKTLEFADTPLLPPSLDALLKQQESSSNAHNDTNTTPTVLLKSLAFGLACGSASCLQQENSVVDLQDVERFVREHTGTFELVDTFTLLDPTKELATES